MSTAIKERAPRKPRTATARPNQSGDVWKLRRAQGIAILESPAIAKLGWLVHGFSTRSGGSSELELRGGRSKGGAIQNVLNLGFAEWDTREHVQANRDKFLRAIRAQTMRPAMLRQIHSDMVAVITAANAASSEPLKADALVTREAGVLLAVQTADCVPILLADPRARAIAAIHSGWRGTLQRIAEKTIGRMRMEFGTRPQDVVAAIGPAIGRCCYEVGSDVAREFHAKFANARDWFDGPYDALASGENDPNWLPWLTMRPPGHPPPSPTVNMDLIAANRAILADAGISPKNISSSDLCSACRADLFFSYRREKITGRMMAAIGIRA